jgi:hypothetical protein
MIITDAVITLKEYCRYVAVTLWPVLLYDAAIPETLKTP